MTNLQGDIIAILDNSGNCVAEYSYDAWGNCTITQDTDGIAEVNPLRYRGYYYDSDTNFYYLQSRYYDAGIGRFINADSAEMIAKGELNLFSYCGNNPVNRSDNNGMFWKQLWNGVKKVTRAVTKVTNLVVRSMGFDTAALGAAILQMYKDRNGVYHATFDCWQQYLGYNNAYDFLFDVFADMRRKKFPFTYNCQQYILWAWKGDYINLGAGAELGIYYGGEPHWKVNKNLAMNMSMTVTYYGKKIISYSAKTWWLTGFNPKYKRINISKLKVTYKVVFNIERMYKAFKNKWHGIWKFNDKKLTATYTF